MDSYSTIFRWNKRIYAGNEENIEVAHTTHEKLKRIMYMGCQHHNVKECVMNHRALYYAVVYFTYFTFCFSLILKYKEMNWLEAKGGWTSRTG